MITASPLRRPRRLGRTVTWLGCGLAAWALACSSSGSDEPAEGAGGSGTTGGAAVTGGSPATGGTTPATGAAPGTGGIATTGGARPTGGTGVGGTGGSPTGGFATGGFATGGFATGGMPTGGIPTGGMPTGGAPTGGMPTGGFATGGLPTGGAPTGGVPTGGAPTGGMSSGGGPTGGAPTGGVATGGEGGVGGMETGGSTSGGAGGTGGQNSGFCPTDEPCRISPLGDSITEDINAAAGYRVNLFRLANEAGKDITFVGTRSNGPNDVGGVPFPKNHEGTSGISIEGLQSTVVEAGKLSRSDVDPHIILLHIGTNNMYGSHPSGPEALLPLLIDEIIADCPDALLVVSTLIPLPMNTSGISAYNAVIPGIVEERAAAGAHIVLVDQFTGFPTSELADQVHPTPAGYDRMGQVWFDAIEQYLP